MRRANLMKFQLSEEEVFTIVTDFLRARFVNLRGLSVRLKFAESGELLVYFTLEEEIFE